ncbi:DUF3857 domain-containing protein [Phenylobacterium sp.]|uniref:DUF3857 domain-containing transglutaminase family protein n=1 Tax=Phenylobacterium sp. TaxID=1871053 RepID=UPI002F95FC99
MADSATIGPAGEPVVRRVEPWDWADLRPFQRTERAREDRSDDGRCFWLSDAQVNLAGPENVYLTRTIVEVVGPDGLQDTAQINLDFDPSYETLVYHYVRVIRGDAVREVDPIPLLSVFRRERDLERARYDGRLTAHLVIPDVRVGDVVDYACSVIGAQPVFRGRFAAEWGFTWACWVGETRVRLLTRPERKLRMQSWNHAPEAEVRTMPSGLVEHTWRALATPAIPAEPDEPNWQRRNARVRVSDPLAWSEVADIFRGHFAAEPLPDDLQAELNEMSSQAAGLADLAVKLLRLVQSGLRYQAVSMGEGGYVPRPVAQIWSARCGDCKDASRLLAALLNHAGFDAVPALVNTFRGWVLDDEDPSTIAFDHCIVRLRLEGASYWLDPTSYPQGGRLDRLYKVHLGWALPLEADAELEWMGDDPVVESWQVDETYELGPEPGSPATLEVTTVYGAWRADAMRRSLANDAAGVVRNYIDYYSRYFGEVSELEPMCVSDDLDENRLETVERYRLSRPYEPHPDNRDLLEFNLLDSFFSEQLTTPRTAARRMMIDVGLPRAGVWISKVVLPHEVQVAAWDRVFEMPGLRGSSKHEGGGRTIKLIRGLSVERRFIPAEEAQTFFDLRDAALRSQGVTVTLETRNGRFLTAKQTKDRPQVHWAWFIWIGVWILYMAYRALSAASAP